MADTGAPWNIPYVTPTDNPRVFPAADEAQALAIAAGLSSASKIVDVKSATITAVFSASVGAGASVDITGLSITHALAADTNKLLIIGDAVVSGTNGRNVGIGPAVGGTLIAGALGDAAGTRVQISSGTNVSVQQNNPISVGFSYLHSPGVTTSLTYTMRAIHIDTGTQTVFVGRGEGEFADARSSRGIATFTLIEVAA